MSSLEAPTVTRSALLGVVGTMSVIFPAFLTGAMAVQVKDGLNLTEADFGLAIGAFFLGSACGSALLGRLAERLGPKQAIRLGLATTILTDLAIAAVANGARSLQLLLVIAGLANALTQPAINLLLVREVDPLRLGFIMALKQSGMPSAALLGGLAVPAIALTVGWRPAYLFAALLAAVAIALAGTGRRPTSPPGVRSPDGEPPSKEPPGKEPPSKEPPGKEPTGLGLSDSGPADRSATGAIGRPRPDLGLAMLLLMAAVGVLGGGAANILVGYLVSGAVDAGIAPGPAGLLLTLGAGLGVASRMIHGWLVDRRPFDALWRVVLMFGIGAVGALGLALATPTGYLLGTPFAFAAGWAWPGLFNLVVVNANRSAPAAATGVTQTGVYVGSLVGPIIAGLLIERSGYQAVWLMTAGALAGAGVTAAMVRRGMAPTVTPSERAEVRAAASGR